MRTHAIPSRVRLLILFCVFSAAGLALAHPALAAESFSVNAAEDQQFSGTVGSFSEVCPLDLGTHPPHHDCGLLGPTATINWGRRLECVRHR